MSKAKGVLIAAAGGNSHLENELGSSWSARSGRIDSTDSTQGKRAAVKGFAGFTNTKEVTPPLVTHLPLGARPSLGHTLRGRAARALLYIPGTIGTERSLASIASAWPAERG